MELRHLITFTTIVDTGGFKKAADELGYVQSSITAHIKELEKELGYPLFDRLGKSITMTQTGERFCLMLSKSLICIQNQKRSLKRLIYQQEN
ncbi:LysR family transcriptional regulator [Sinobaca sp. H24]|uniref:LysR family transcriptional regulator n=1 Tax=Sinobaca sp. H24 TaxID=2923376 RepID=UPI002079CAE0|nr:LysR family transcriptional regulator [Sinobaca sp. H24]